MEISNSLLSLRFNLNILQADSQFRSNVITSGFEKGNMETVGNVETWNDRQ